MFYGSHSKKKKKKSEKKQVNLVTASYHSVLFKILSFQYMTLVTFQALSSCLWVAAIWDSTA